MQDMFSNEIDKCMLSDQFKLKKQLTQLRKLKASDTRHNTNRQKLVADINRSQTTVKERRAGFPVIEYPAQLPISDKRALVATALKEHQVIILAGETGSGKTTQIPKICLELGLGAKGLIGHTQPRRLAARAVATRIADELNVALGKTVGYQVRFTDNTDSTTLIKLMTDGILLAEIQHDRNLSKYEVLIIDEAHERSLNIDFLLGYLRQLLPKRPDLKLIITSATIDVEKFSKHFNDAPIISVAGRTFPVDIVYRPINNEADDDDSAAEKMDDSLTSSVLNALKEIELDERKQGSSLGDVLVFLSGEREIRDLAAELRKHPLRHTEVLPLYARLTPAEQNRIFATHAGRRVILATNVAETSLTVPGIVYVIDTGYARISRYSLQSKVQRLPIERISQASANQRAGRCGRISSGVCFRLYSEDDFNTRPPFTDPEIQRTNLSSVILQMLMLGLGNIEAFPFVEKPDQKAINDGFKLLLELGAIDRERRLSRIGRMMAAIPADPRLARMLIEANAKNCLADLLIIVSALSVQDPREFPPDKKQATREKHAQFSYPESDFLAWVVLWYEFEKQRQELTQSVLRQYCKNNFLSFTRMREWRETHRQLHLSCQQMGLRENNRADMPREIADINYESVHRAIIRGSLNQLGIKTDEKVYLGSRNRKFAMFPTSILSRKMPKWVVTAELIETSRLYATMAARIQPEWAVDAAGELLKRDYSEAHWEKNRGEVIAFEKISLFGLTLIERQRVSYSNVDPVLSRDIFIREALVGQELDTRASFFKHNTDLIEQLRKEEEKQRRPDIIAGEDQLYAFYASRIPVDIVDSRSFEYWLKGITSQEPKILHMSLSDLLQRDLDDSTATNYPDQALVQNNALDIDYNFRPGTDDDGASITVPLNIIAQMNEADIDWAIPGQLRERCIALLKGLPKGSRKHFIPVPDFVDDFLTALNLNESISKQKSLIETLREYVRKRKGVDLDKAAMRQVEVPNHLLPRICVVGHKGEVIARNHSLKELQQKYSQSAITALSGTTSHPIEREGITAWDFGELPSEVTIEAAVSFIRYPALVDCGKSVSIVLQDNRKLAAQLSRKGLARLFMFRTVQQRNDILKRIRRLERQLALKLPNTAIDFGEECLLAIYQIAFELVSTPIPVNQAQFEAQLNAGKSALIETTETFERLLGKVVEAHFQMRKQLQGLGDNGVTYAKEDIQSQIDKLIFPEYLSTTPPEWLLEYPRYFKAIEVRLERLLQHRNKDHENTKTVSYLQDRLGQLAQSNAQMDMVELRWMLEELRVSLFAQSVKTRFPISEKRILKRMDELQSS